MTRLTEHNFWSVLAESPSEPCLTGTTVPQSIAPKQIQMDMSGIACAVAFLAVVAGFSIAGAVWKLAVPGFRAAVQLFGVLVCLLLVASLAGGSAFGARFRRSRGLRASHIATALLQTTGAALLLAFMPFALSHVAFGSPADSFQDDPFQLGGTGSFALMAWVIAGAAVALGALFSVRPIARIAAVRFTRPRRVLVVGGTEGFIGLVRRLRYARPRPVTVLGVVDYTEGPTSRAVHATPVSFCDLPVAGGLHEFVGMVQRAEVDTVIIALPWSEAEHIRAIVWAADSAAVDILHVPEPDDFDIPAIPVAQLAGIPLSQAVDAPLIGWQALLKRMEDVVVAGAITLLAAPVIVAVAVLVKLTSPGPIFARQKWVGHKGRSFEALRFRTTYTLLSDESGAAQPDRGNRRITPLGGWLRRSCLDELPQLLNVLRGDMSLVGPRPHLMVMPAHGVSLEQAAPIHRLWQRVKPGVTGWAQVSRNRRPLHSREEAEDRLALDLEYIRHWSLALDLKIIWLTIRLTLNDQKAY